MNEVHNSGSEPKTDPRQNTYALVPEPLVSCIMPSANRRGFVPLAIRGFQAQEYPNKELIIVDDGEDAVRDLVPDDDRVRYIR